MHRRAVSALLMTLLLPALIAAQETEDEAAPTLRVGTSGDYAPFSIAEGEDYRGFDGILHGGIVAAEGTNVFYSSFNFGQFAIHRAKTLEPITAPRMTFLVPADTPVEAGDTVNLEGHMGTVQSAVPMDGNTLVTLTAAHHLEIVVLARNAHALLGAGGARVGALLLA